MDFNSTGLLKESKKSIKYNFSFVELIILLNIPKRKLNGFPLLQGRVVRICYFIFRIVVRDLRGQKVDSEIIDFAKFSAKHFSKIYLLIS